MNAKYKFSIIPHTHWDREWYFTTSKSILYSLVHFKDIIEHLKKDNEFKCFLLDGQTSIIDDYINMHPEDEEDICNLVKQRKLYTGPWYTQTDQLVISGESIVRNLYYGTNRAKKLGNCMMVGYMPDSFGQSAQMPQIYNGFNINKTVFRRGLSSYQIDESEFYWKTLSENSVFVHNVRDYGNMINPPEDEENLKLYIDNKIKTLGSISKTNNIFLMNGGDQRPIRHNLVEIIEKAKKIYPEYEFEINNIEDVLETMKNQNLDFKTYKGEMTLGQHSRVHKSIFSTRADLKRMNNKAENLITNIAEPLSTIGYKLGIKYENKVLEKAWKLLCENAAHDSIGMCNSDRTNADVEYRYRTVFDLLDNLIDLNMRLIGMSVEEKDIFQFQVYNLLPYKRDNVLEVRVFTPSDKFNIVDPNNKKIRHIILESNDVTNVIKNESTQEVGIDGIINPKWLNEDVKIYDTKMLIELKDVESIGYKTLFFDTEKEAEIESLEETECKNIENEYLKVEVNDNGSVNIENKILGKKLNGVLIFENSGDDGDTYDYSQPRKDFKIMSTDCVISNLKSTRSILQSSISFSTELNVPQDLKYRENQVLNITIPIKVEITINSDSKLVDFNIDIENKASEHRMRVLFKTNIESKVSIADQQFGTIQRPVKLDEEKVWENEGWNEKPRTIEPMQTYVTLKGKEYGVCLFTDCTREYQIVGEEYDTIALTLYRSVSFMGKSDLLDRPGRASGMQWQTPDSEIKKKLSFNFTLYIYGNEEDTLELSKISKEIYTPFIYHQAAHFKNNVNYFILPANKERKSPIDYSLLRFKDNKTVLSCIKKEEKGDGLVIRLFNPSYENLSDEIIEVYDKAKSVKLVKLDEETVVEDIEDTDKIQINNIKKCEVRTLLIK